MTEKTTAPAPKPVSLGAAFETVAEAYVRDEAKPAAGTHWTAFDVCNAFIAGAKFGRMRAANEFLASQSVQAPQNSRTGLNWENPNDPAVKLFVGFDVEGYVEEYELRGDDGDYSPNEQEKTLLIDAIYGVVSNLHEELRKIIPSGSAPQVLSRWLPISKADRTITDVQDFSEVGIMLRTSERYWVRDNDGRIFEACWSEGEDHSYWWDLEGESPVDPVEFMPHPLDPKYSAAEGPTE